MFKNISAIIIIIIFLNELITELTGKETSDMSRAEELYIQQCSKCHRKNGRGIKMVYPPVRDSDYIKKQNAEELLRGMLFGRSGKIVVNDETYNGVMTTEVDKSLSDDDIASILTYVLNEFNGISKIVSGKEVKAARKAGKLPEHK